MPDGNRAQHDMPLQSRVVPISNFNRDARTFDVTWTTGAAVRRYDYWNERAYDEVLSLEPGHVRMGRLTSGAAPVLDSHRVWAGLEAVFGVVESAGLDGKRGTASLRLSKREELASIVADIADGILRNVSVGYFVHKVERIPPSDGSNVWVYRVIDWEPFEISLVSVGADADAGLRASQIDGERRDSPDALQARTVLCEFLTLADAALTRKEPHMSAQTAANNPAPAAAQPAANNPAPASDAQRQIEEARAEGQRIELERQAGIRSVCATLGLSDAFRQQLIDDVQVTLDVARQRAIDEKAKESAANPTRGQASHIDVIGDEHETRIAAMTEAIEHRLAPTGKLSDAARDYRYMSLSRLAETCLVKRGVSIRGMSAHEIVTRAMMTTSDFTNVLAAVTNKRLRAAYDENQPSYTRWARRAANAVDFKAIYPTQISGAPDLVKVNEAGEIKFGQLFDGKTSYNLLTYGRRIMISRQAVINDDLRAFDTLPRAFGGAARRLENRLVYAELTANGNMSDGNALFDASNHGNYTSSGTVISVASLAVGRTAMRKQKGLQSEELNITPAYLILPASLEQVGYQYTSASYVPAQSSNINEFRAGGRTALEPIVEPVLDATSAVSWYLAANSGQIDTVEYCFLEGAEGVRIESQVQFDTDGMALKAVHDFAAKVIDWRGLYKNAGA